MASLSSTVNHCYHFHSRKMTPKLKQFTRKSSVIACCRGNEPSNGDGDGSNSRQSADEEESEKRLGMSFRANLFEIAKFGDVLKPKQKGDWKDVTLMSLALSLYVYISQRLVCAYFIWMSMPRQQW